jgi:hypothetical protein
MSSRIRYLLSSPREIWEILLVCAAVFSVAEVLYYTHYLASLKGLMDVDSEPLGRDFISYWTAITLLKAHNIGGLYSMPVFASTMRDNFYGKDIGMFWGYPPQYLFLLWPFTFIASYKLAYALWTVFNLTAFAFAVFWRTPLTLSWRWIMVCSPVVFIECFIGQNGLLTSALLIGGLRLLALRPCWAGFLFGLLAFKPQLGILLPFVLLALRQYKAFAAAALTVTVFVLLSGFVFGWEGWQWFFHSLQTFPQGAYHKMVSVSAGLRSMGLSLNAGTVIQLLTAILVASALCYRLRRMQGDHWIEWASITVPAVYLATPYAFPYDLCALNASWLLWLKRQGDKPVSPYSTFAWLLLWFAPFFSEAANDQRVPLTTLLILVVFVMAWKETRR